MFSFWKKENLKKTRTNHILSSMVDIKVLRKFQENTIKAHFEFHSKSTFRVSHTVLLWFLRQKIKARQIKLEMEQLFPIRIFIKHWRTLKSSSLPMFSKLLLRTGYFCENCTPNAEPLIISEEILENVKIKLQDALKVLEECSHGNNCLLIISSLWSH